MTVKKYFQLIGNKIIKPILIFLCCGLLFTPILPSTMNLPRQNLELLDVESNMLTFQTMLETYAVDWGGVYPNNVNELYFEAKENRYLRKLLKTYEPEQLDQKMAFDGKLFDFDERRFVSDVERFKINLFEYPFVIKERSKYQGKIIYRPHQKKGLITEYAIYGTNKSGRLLKYKNGIYYLSNS